VTRIVASEPDRNHSGLDRGPRQGRVIGDIATPFVLASLGLSVRGAAEAGQIVRSPRAAQPELSVASRESAAACLAGGRSNKPSSFGIGADPGPMSTASPAPALRSADRRRPQHVAAERELVVPLLDDGPSLCKNGRFRNRVISPALGERLLPTRAELASLLRGGDEHGTPQNPSASQCTAGN
jgi:hypothetical protein